MDLIDYNKYHYRPETEEINEEETFLYYNCSDCSSEIEILSINEFNNTI